MFPGRRPAARPAVVMAGSGETLTYGELERDSIRLARLLQQRGLQPGDGLALLSDNRPEALVAYWAARRSGLYVTAVSWHLTAEEAAYVVQDCGAKAVVVSTGVGDVARTATADVPVRLAFGGPVEGFEDLQTALADVSDERPAYEPKGTDMLYSSGTTGRPKGIRPPLPQAPVDDPNDVLCQVFGRSYGFGEDTVYLSPAPIYHAAPLRYCGMTHALGGTVVLMERFDAAAFLEAIGRHHVTHTQVVPTMLVRLLKLDPADRERADLSSLRAVIHAAAPCPAEVKQATIDWLGPIVHEYYAGTEAVGITMIDSEQWLGHPGSVGRSMLGPVHVCAEDGRELAVGETGTIFFQQPPGMSFSYHGDPAKTKAAQHPDHTDWTTMGDVGHLDEEGFVYLTDRLAFTIISGGVNVYPQETEDVLALHPQGFDVAVIGVPDPEYGEAVKAVVVPAEGVEPTPELAAELVAFVRGRLSHVKCPRSVDFVDALPRTPTGKLVKGRLRERYASASPATSSSS